ncbi:MAG: hypothetical protein IJ719_12395 [Clostridia bacterium]|nr:hypothetical protein [Clostridia bacterium]
MTKKDLEIVYRQNLELDIIEYIAQKKNVSQRKAMDIYYNSKLSEQIQTGRLGIDNLDAKYLAEDLIENEPGLFESK